MLHVALTDGENSCNIILLCLLHTLMQNAGVFTVEHRTHFQQKALIMAHQMWESAPSVHLKDPVQRVDSFENGTSVVLERALRGA